MPSNSLRYENVPINSLVPNDYNPNQMSDGQFEALKKTLQKDGFLGVVLANRTGDRLVIVDGEKRWKAAAEVGMQTIPCLVVEIPEKKAKALTIKLNQISGEWNAIELVALLQGLPDPLDELGFSEYEFLEELERLAEDRGADQLLTDIAAQMSEHVRRAREDGPRYVGFVLSLEQQVLLTRALCTATEKAGNPLLPRSEAFEAIVRGYLAASLLEESHP